MPVSARSPSLSDDAGVRRAGPKETARTSGAGPASIDAFPGRLIVLEGTDGAGRSTHIALLREWLETQGFGVIHTALARSRLAGDGLRRAKQGNTLGQRAMDLYYATDFADRLENEILPALRAGFVVLTDRYIYSMIVRSIVRIGDREWIRDLYRFAPTPHAVFYLKVDLPNLTPRVLTRGSFDYWESGLDFQEETDLYKSFDRYQARLLAVFDELALQYQFRVIDANRDIGPVFRDLRAGIEQVVSGMEGAKSWRA
jgi:dTMP kinase